MARAKTLDVDGPSAPRQAGIVLFTRLAGKHLGVSRLGVARIRRLKGIDGDCRAIRSSREVARSAALMLTAHQRDLALRSVLCSDRSCRRAIFLPSLMLAPPFVTNPEAAV